jgi:hypothetical protein
MEAGCPMKLTRCLFPTFALIFVLTAGWSRDLESPTANQGPNFLTSPISSDAFQVRYAANLSIGDSLINISGGSTVFGGSWNGFGQTSGTFSNTGSSGQPSWASSSFGSSSGNQNNGSSPSALLSADAFTDRIADRANVVDNRNHDPPLPPRYTCFVSFSSVDLPFVRMFVADLRENGVECFFAPDSVRIGASFREEITKAIKVHEKLILIMSHRSIRSQYVEAEVEMAFAEERRRGSNILFPLRLDLDIDSYQDGWAGDIQRMRNVGDMTGWQDETKYRIALARVLTDLVKS